MSCENGFPSPLELPFNRDALDGQFELSVPDSDPSGEGVWLLLQGGAMLLAEGPDERVLPGGPCPLSDPSQPPLYIGQWQGQPCRLLKLAKGQPVPDGLHLQPLRAVEPKISVALLSLGGLGQMIQHWEKTSRHCGNCGAPMTRLPGEWGKQCPSCRAHHFPRIHPCVIGLVIRGKQLLLARKAEWEPGRFSLVAGFVEFGECLEEAMARETLEETGIQIKNIRYLGSQSWPFPSQLMCGFVADYEAGEIDLQEDELEDAGWFTLDQLPTLPPRRSIARHLIDRAAEFVAADDD